MRGGGEEGRETVRPYERDVWTSWHPGKQEALILNIWHLQRICKHRPLLQPEQIGRGGCGTISHAENEVPRGGCLRDSQISRDLINVQ